MLGKVVTVLKGSPRIQNSLDELNKDPQIKSRHSTKASVKQQEKKEMSNEQMQNNGCLKKSTAK